MPLGAQRYVGAAFGFAFAAVWATVGLGAAVVCLVAAGIGYGAVSLAERRQFAGIAGVRDAVLREAPNRRRQPRVAARSSMRRPQPRRERPEPAQPVATVSGADTATYGW